MMWELLRFHASTAIMNRVKTNPIWLRNKKRNLFVLVYTMKDTAYPKTKYQLTVAGKALAS